MYMYDRGSIINFYLSVANQVNVEYVGGGNANSLLRNSNCSGLSGEVCFLELECFDLMKNCSYCSFTASSC